jgi:hypothetical protein
MVSFYREMEKQEISGAGEEGEAEEERYQLQL